MDKPIAPTAEEGAYAGDLSPRDTWDMLQNQKAASLIDVRTDAECAYVGLPVLDDLGKDVKIISWTLFPGGNKNPYFVTELNSAAPDKDADLFFLCRSGVRSRFAAALATEIGYRNSYNILEGFEGDKDENGHRGSVNGWKVAGLPWKQG
ncbi:MAG: sulfurtransferase [Magnetovibrio sp.]|nr:sulfurtransferase [Magnetovibrio sp.]